MRSIEKNIWTLITHLYEHHSIRYTLIIQLYSKLYKIRNRSKVIVEFIKIIKLYYYYHRHIYIKSQIQYTSIQERHKWVSAVFLSKN